MFIHAAKNETFYLAVSICAAKNESFKLSNTIHAAKTETFKLNKEVNAPVQETFQLLSPAAFVGSTGAVVAGAEWLNFVYPICIPSLTLKSPAGEEDFSNFIVRTSLKKHLGGKTMLSLKLVEPGAVAYSTTFAQLLKPQPSTINPWHVGFADPNGRLIRHNFTTRTTMKLAYDYGNDQYGFRRYLAPTMLPLEPKFNGEELEWEFEDIAGLLERQNISMVDIDADAPTEARSASAPNASIVSDAISAIRRICDQSNWYTNGVSGTPVVVGSAVINVVANFANFAVRLLRCKNGSPLDWVDMIAKIRQAKRRSSGSTLIFSPVTPPHLGSPKWTFVEGLHIEAGSFQAYQDMSDYKNKFSVSRTSPQGGFIGEQECIGGQCVGRTGNISFDLPVTACAAQIEVTNGEIQDFVYFKDSTPVYADPIYALGPSGSTYLGPVTNRVEFTYKARIGLDAAGSFGGIGGAAYNSSIVGSNAGLIAYVPRYKVTYYGKLDSQVGVNAVYTFVAQDAGQIAAFGEWPEYGNIEDPILADYDTMVAYAQALLREATRKMWWVRFRTKYVIPDVEPGDIFELVDFSTEVDHNWLVEEMTLTTENGESTMEVLGSRGGV